ncbi:MAG: BadF/BadG/BcrA/BcrD ATPase family protein [Verrucomicrobiota bacterium]|nr:BadF/BadG/BcrA/BcrD ATPase family protein [Verrucomicrobiota bacterium]
MEKIILAVDGGGTTSRAVLVNEQGFVIGLGHDGPANPKAVGWQQARNTVGAVAAQAWQRAGYGIRPASAAFLGLAGLRLRMEQESFLDYLAPLSLAPMEMMDCDHDLRIALEGGLPGQPGIVLVAGTGSACYGRNAAGESTRAGGWGWLIDDGGSGCWLGMEALRAVARAADGRAPATALTDTVNRAWGQESADEIPVNFYKNPLPRDWVAKLAPLVFEAAARKDKIARGIIQEGCNELANLAVAVAAKLQFGPEPYSIVIAGGLLNAGDAFFKPLQRALTKRLPNATLIQPMLPPVLGAALVAMQRLGIAITPEVIEHLKSAADSIENPGTPPAVPSP